MHQPDAPSGVRDCTHCACDCTHWTMHRSNSLAMRESTINQRRQVALSTSNDIPRESTFTRRRSASSNEFSPGAIHYQPEASSGHASHCDSTIPSGVKHALTCITRTTLRPSSSLLGPMLSKHEPSPRASGEEFEGHPPPGSPNYLSAAHSG